MENKKLTGILLVVLILGLGGIYYLHFRQGIHRIAYIDSQKVIQGYEGMKKARKEYEKRSKEWKAKMDTLITEWENELRHYEREKRAMSAKEKQLKEELLRARQQQINNYQQGLQQKAREEEMKLNESIAGEINVFLTEYGRKHGYEFILGANATGNVVYARPARDISEDVLKGLNERYNAQAR